MTIDRGVKIQPVALVTGGMGGVGAAVVQRLVADRAVLTRSSPTASRTVRPPSASTVWTRARGGRSSRSTVHSNTPSTPRSPSDVNSSARWPVIRSESWAALSLLSAVALGLPVWQAHLVG